MLALGSICKAVRQLQAKKAPVEVEASMADRAEASLLLRPFKAVLVAAVATLAAATVTVRPSS